MKEIRKKRAVATIECQRKEGIKNKGKDDYNVSDTRPESGLSQRI